MVGLFDYKYFKWIAVIFGWYFAGFFGAIIAYFLVDSIIFNRDKNIDFEIALLRICSMLIKSDGRVEQVEVEVVRNYFRRTFGTYKTNKIFNQVKTSPLKDFDLEQLVEVVKNKVIPTQYYAILQLLYAVAVSDGKISKNEEELIIRIGLQMQFTRDRIQTIRNQFSQTGYSSGNESQDHLAILGLSSGASKSDIKSAYRSLAKEFHPDKLTGMSKGIQDLAKEKFQQIQNAYEALTKST
tara:strand:- start:3230 stop:3949 length:720 start_codon:yes stop_codon:yes gene_type:complete